MQKQILEYGRFCQYSSRRRTCKIDSPREGKYHMTIKITDFQNEGYKQDKELDKWLGGVLSQRSDVNRGICLSLCMNWIYLHKKYHKMGNGERYRIESMKSRIRGLMSETVHFQRALNSQAWDYALAREGNGSSVRDHLNGVGKKYGLEFSAEEIPAVPAGARSLAEAVPTLTVNRNHAYTMTIIRFTGGAHAICAYKSGGKFFGLGSHLYLFDPNFGEFRIPTSSISDFYVALFKKYPKFTSRARTHTANFLPGSY